MVRTRVGYAGGTKKNPTYRSLGDHAETIQIDYDPAVISYQKLLDVFWKNHDPASPIWSKQYRSILFFHNEEQRRLAIELRDREQARIKGKVHTEIIPFTAFYLAEEYQLVVCNRFITGNFHFLVGQGPTLTFMRMVGTAHPTIFSCT